MDNQLYVDEHVTIVVNRQTDRQTDRWIDRQQHPVRQTYWHAKIGRDIELEIMQLRNTEPKERDSQTEVAL